VSPVEVGWRERLGRLRIVAPLLLALSPLAGVPSAAHAAPVVWGVTGGVVGARLHGNYGDLFDGYRAGGAIGAHARFALQPWLSFQPELWWILKGGRAETSIVDVFGSHDLEYAHSIPYIELPLLLRLQLPSNGTFEPFVAIGPTVAARVGGHLELPDLIAFEATPHQRPQMANIFVGLRPLDRPDYKDWDWGLLGGAGVLVGQGRMRVKVEGRYERGFADILPGSYADGSTNGVIIGLVGIEAH